MNKPLPVTVTRHQIRAARNFHVPYEGDDPLVRAQFPDGFFPSFGSGLAFKAKDADGTLTFYCLTDRGPNGEGPRLAALSGQGKMDSKIFPAPGFAPAIGILQLDARGAAITAVAPIRLADGTLASGLPLPPSTLGSSGEIPLFNAMQFDPDGRAVFKEGGLDSEALAWDARRQLLWISDEYGPFLIAIDPSSGVIRRRYGPGQGLPEILAMRRPNRGMEGMTLDPHTDRIHAFLQSPLTDGKEVERHARFTRWIEFDPEAGATTAMYAYPLDPAEYAQGRTGNAKLGDLVALGQGRFIVIEQGEGADGGMRNWLMLVDTAGATDISGSSSALEKSSLSGGASWAAVTPLRKTPLLDLRALGWVAEKAEGLALVDAHTLAITNDNDFGMKTRVYAGDGAERIGADPDQAFAAGDLLRVARGDAAELPLTLWLLRFDQALAP